VTADNQNKYIKEQLSMAIYIYAGENLSSFAKMKLMSCALALERYITRGGVCAISKLYHEYEDIADIKREIKDGKDN
jgi:hypothetical protein